MMSRGMSANYEQRTLLFIIDRLLRSLEPCTGKLRALDAYGICGGAPGMNSSQQRVLIRRALHEMGWKLQRCRFAGVWQFAYVKEVSS